MNDNVNVIGEESTDSYQHKSYVSKKDLIEMLSAML